MAGDTMPQFTIRIELVTLNIILSGVEVRDFGKITDHFKGINRMCFKSNKENGKITTCNQLDLETIRF